MAAFVGPRWGRSLMAFLSELMLHGVLRLGRGVELLHHRLDLLAEVGHPFRLLQREGVGAVGPVPDAPSEHLGELGLFQGRGPYRAAPLSEPSTAAGPAKPALVERGAAVLADFCLTGFGHALERARLLLTEGPLRGTDEVNHGGAPLGTTRYGIQSIFPEKLRPFAVFSR